mmetsp:Transcript_35327/g.77220  ORF Transcript_35327/g.77220 Transcript_35327/m.77220 type:complete len:235 (+) Transcript_35327:375-1079(+)
MGKHTSTCWMGLGCIEHSISKRDGPRTAGRASTAMLSQDFPVFRGPGTQPVEQPAATFRNQRLSSPGLLHEPQQRQVHLALHHELPLSTGSCSRCVRELRQGAEERLRGNYARGLSCLCNRLPRRTDAEGGYLLRESNAALQLGGRDSAEASRLHRRSARAGGVAATCIDSEDIAETPEGRVLFQRGTSKAEAPPSLRGWRRPVHLHAGFQTLAGAPGRFFHLAPDSPCLPSKS